MRGDAVNGPVVDVLRLPPLGHDRHDLVFGHVTASSRSMAALMLLAGGAMLLIVGALCTLGKQAHFGVIPLRFLLPSGVVARRGDRLSVHQQLASADHLTHVEQLADDGAGMEPFTHLVARLGEDLPPAPRRHAPRATPMAEAGPSLPREILYGGSQEQGQSPAVSAYAPSNLREDEAGDHAAGVAVNAAVIVKHPAMPVVQPRVVVAKPADTLPHILEALGTPAADAAAISRLLTPKGWFGAKAFAGGEKITVVAGSDAEDPTGWHALKVSVERPGKPAVSVARTDDGRYVPVAAVEAAGQSRPSADADEPRPVAHESLRDALYAMAAANHVDHAVINRMMGLCTHDIDLDTPLSGRETAELLYSNNHRGERVLAFAALALPGHTYRYYRFTAPDDHSTDYYDAEGHSVTQSLLRKPVAAGRLGDGFGWRMHPVLGVRKFHEGVDYAAPFGSPIVAAGAGVVELINRQIGYGNYIRIRHDLGYETTYAHISSVAHGIKVGMRVHQGETIAFVGSTGYSTGPHLYYELRINGHDVDPLRVRLRSGRMLEGEVLSAFESGRARTDQLLHISAAR